MKGKKNSEGSLASIVGRAWKPGSGGPDTGTKLTELVTVTTVLPPKSEAWGGGGDMVKADVRGKDMVDTTNHHIGR